jgi:hypothetical protein
MLYPTYIVNHYGHHAYIFTVFDNLPHITSMANIGLQPSFQTPRTRLNELRGSLPNCVIPDDIDHAAVTANMLQNMDQFSNDHWTEEALWRDLLALTGTLRTFYTRAMISEVWKKMASIHHPRAFKLRLGSSLVRNCGPQSCWVQAMFDFRIDNPSARCSGLVGLVPGAQGNWKIWFMTTILEQFDDWPNPDALQPVAQTKQVSDPADVIQEGDTRGRASGSTSGDLHRDTSAPDSLQKPAADKPYFDCIVVGGGYSGLALGGRLKALGISLVILEKNSRVGGNWLNRYSSMKLHTSREYAQLPFSRTFSAKDPYFLASEDLARGYQNYVDQYDIVSLLLLALSGTLLTISIVVTDIFNHRRSGSRSMLLPPIGTRTRDNGPCPFRRTERT